MLFSSWLRDLACGADRLRAAPPGRAPRRHLSLEALEDRVVPSGMQDLLYIGNATPPNFPHDSVQRLNTVTGQSQTSFVSSDPSENGGLHGVQGLIFDHQGNLLVASQNPNPFTTASDIFRYRPSGKLLNPVISHTDHDAPFAAQGIVLGPDDTLYVADLREFSADPDSIPDGEIKEYKYDEDTGAAVFQRA